MEVIYVGITSGTSGARLQALRDLGNDVQVFDYTKYIDSKTQFGRLLGYVLFSGTGVRRANADLVCLARERRADVIWVDKADWLYPGTMAALRKMGNYLVHHVTDALFPSSVFMKIQRRYLVSNSRFFHTIFTTNRHDWEILREEFGDVLVRTKLGYDHRRCKPLNGGSKVRDHFESDVVFVGHREPRTEKGILALIAAGVRIRVQGVGWSGTKMPQLLRRSCDPLTDDEYVRVLQTAKIALGYVSQWNYNETAGRSFEIPASGAFLLGIRTAEHQESYEEGVEAEFFGSEAELCEKTVRYLADAEAREKIAFAGAKRCITSGYSYHEITTKDWSIVAERLAARRSSNGAPV